MEDVEEEIRKLQIFLVICWHYGRKQHTRYSKRICKRS